MRAHPRRCAADLLNPHPCPAIADHGGKYDFIRYETPSHNSRHVSSLTRLCCATRWAGANTDDGSQFYSNSKVIAIFKDYISVVLNHVNTYTGVRCLSSAQPGRGEQKLTCHRPSQVALKDDPTILGARSSLLAR